MNAYYCLGQLLRAGGRHVMRGQNCQDNATIRASPHGIVLVVADGVSGRDGLLEGRPSRTEVGAYLCAEAAACAAIECIDDPDRVPAAVGEALASLVGPLAARLGPHFRPALPCTLLVAVLTPTSAHVWLSGDGMWGVTIPPGGQADVLEHVLHEAENDEGKTVQCGIHLRSFKKLASTMVLQGPAAVTADLQLVLRTNCPVVSLWVATDGLEDEPGVLEALRAPIRARKELANVFSQKRPEDCASDDEVLATLVAGKDKDDLGLAFATAYRGIVVDTSPVEVVDV